MNSLTDVDQCVRLPRRTKQNVHKATKQCASGKDPGDSGQCAQAQMANMRLVQKGIVTAVLPRIIDTAYKSTDSEEYSVMQEGLNWAICPTDELVEWLLLFLYYMMRLKILNVHEPVQERR